jgi:hypothetical protein
MHRNRSLSFVPLLMLHACATASLNVTQAPLTAPPKFTRVAVPAFENRVGDALPPGATEEIAGAVIATLQKDYPNRFGEVVATPANAPGELLVRGAVIAYNPGSKAARFILIGLGAGDLKLEVTLIDAQSGAVLEEFSTDGAIVAGGLAGASMGMEDMVNSAAQKIAERVAAYQGP